MATTKAPRAGAAAPRLAKSTRTVPATAKRAYASIKLTMPQWYIDTLGQEAERLRWSRGQFLELLVLRARGQMQVDRNPAWPKLKEPRDPGPNQIYLWNCPREVMADLDKIKNPRSATPCGSTSPSASGSATPCPSALPSSAERAHTASRARISSSRSSRKTTTTSSASVLL